MGSFCKISQKGSGNLDEGWGDDGPYPLSNENLCPADFIFQVASELKTASSVDAVRMASPQASNAGSVALLNFCLLYTSPSPRD